MTRRLSLYVCSLFFVLHPGLIVAQLSYDHWNVLIQAQNSVQNDSLSVFGIRADATSDFDNAYDVPRPPRAPSGNYLEVYFPHSGGNYPPILGTKYAGDYQGPSDPTWNFSVESSVPGLISLMWDQSYVNTIEDRVQLFLYDGTTGSLTNMRENGSYSFSYSTKRNFQIIGAVKIQVKYLMEGFWNGATQPRDTIAGYLTQPGAPFTIVDSAHCFLSENGEGQLIFSLAESGNYYLVIRHRNHLELWSALTVGAVQGTTSLSDYDFSTDAGKAYGSEALKPAGSVFVSWGGDVNQDGVVDFADRNITWNHRNESGHHPSDCNGDGITNSDDYTLVLNNRYKIRQRP